MKYKPEERIEIGRKIYQSELNRYEAAKLYGISEETARKYAQLYWKERGLLILTTIKPNKLWFSIFHVSSLINTESSPIFETTASTMASISCLDLLISFICCFFSL